LISLTAVCRQRSRDDFRWGAWRATKTHMPKLHLALFTAINLLNYLDRYLVAAVLPLIMSDMALTNEEGGRLVAAFVFGYFLFSPVFGYLGDRYDRPKLMALGVVVWSLATIGTGLATGFAVFFAVRILVGIGEASFSTIAPGFLKDRIGDPIKLNSALAIFFAAIPVGAALGYVVGGEVAHHLNWQAAFFVGGIPGILLAVFLLRFRDQRAAPSGEARAAVGVRAVFARPILRYAIGGYVLNTFALTGLAAFVTKYGVELGFDIAEINRAFGLILVLSGFLGTVCGGKLASVLAARSGDTTGTLFRFIGVSALIGAPAMWCAFTVADRNLFLVLCFVAELLVFAATAPVNSLIVVNAPERGETITQGVTIFCLNLFGALLAPIVVGRIADASSLTTAMQVGGGVMLMSGVVWLLGARVSRAASLPSPNRTVP
jgi:MFS family permease